MSDQFIGVDVGGTKIAIAKLQDGAFTEPEVTYTEQSSQEALVEQLAGRLEASRGADTRAIGIGLPSVIEFATGRILSSVNIPLKDLPLRELLTERVGVPVHVENDASCAALAEAFEDGRLTCPELVMFTIGTGVGGGWVLNGKLYRGARTSAAEVGHWIIGRELTDGDEGAEEPFPQRGSLETLASGRALDRLAARAATQYPDSHLGRSRADRGVVTGTDVVDGARAGDAASLYCLRVLGHRLGIGIANAINTFDPLEVVIGGGVSRAGEMLVEPARDAAYRHVVPGLGTHTTIRIARHGPRAGVYGAALLAAQEHAQDTGGDLQGAVSGDQSELA
ncbi:ROK family protein [Candidatus Solirubrobacter pratensis]|uniref:ROK family protein n=1 Tax=Candidatus Solirubrobacter pratensis TaxID=1298857 RepID=UPI000417FE96|nr:ROK family protein [Candidatus Solirubrobacter pratensis]